MAQVRAPEANVCQPLVTDEENTELNVLEVCDVERAARRHHLQTANGPNQYQ